MTKRLAILVAVLLAVVQSASAQFFTEGRGRTSTRWQQIDSTNYKLVYPSGYYPKAASIATLLDSVHPYISYGFEQQPMKVPIILRTENMYSNGFVTWAPKREELVMTSPLDSHSLSWEKHLSVHEWRHVMQISSLKQGITKVASWFLGEAGISLGLAVVPRWVLEGDAVLAETQFAEFGRGIQPDFTLEYRAIFADGNSDMKHLDKWVCGSYKNHYPDIYKFGYQTLSAAATYLGQDYFGSMMNYAGRYPIFIMPLDIYLKDKHKTSFKKIAQSAFGELDSLWTPYANVTENFEHLTTENKKSYTTYSYPMGYNGDVLAVKSDYDTPSRLVNTTTGKDVAILGSISSPTTIIGDKIYYTEYLPHPIFEQVSFSAIRSYNFTTGQKETFHRWGQNFCVTKTDNGFATISQDSLNNSIIRLFDNDFNEKSTHRFSENIVSLHGLTYDSESELLCFIKLTQKGMNLSAIDSKGNEIELTKPNIISISNLSAKGGTLYYSSIESGKNEIHSLDINSRKEHRLTTSRFGSQMPVAYGDSLLMTTYTAGGYMVAEKSLNDSPLDTISWSRLPKNILNPKRLKWDVPKIDTIELSTVETEDPKSKYKPSFAVHSWAPVAFDGDYLMENRPMNLTFGVTAFFQSSLSEFTGYATYGWLNNSNWLKGRIEYKGLPLTISLGAEYGGGNQYFYGGNNLALSGQKVEPYFSTDLTLSLPLNLSGGGYSNLLQPSFSTSYVNSKLYDYSESEYKTGMVQYGASLWWSSDRYMAKRNLAPRWGYAVRGDVSGSFDSNVGTIYALYARGYMPGFAKNHSFSLRAAAQVQDLSTYNTSTKALYLTGVNDIYATEHYGAAIVDYSLPIVYPDWGWDGVIYFSRIRANLFGGYSLGNYLTQTGTTLMENYTYGVDLGIDFTFLRSYAQGVSFTFAMPNGKFYFGMGYNMGF